MAAPADPVTGLTPQQEAFAQAVASGLSLFAAYHQAYNVSPDTLPNSVYPSASLLASSPKVALRIKTLRADLQAAVAEKRVWDALRMIDEAEVNLTGARADHEWASANGSLALIGRVTGLTEQKSSGGGTVAITKVTVVLSSRVEPLILEGTVIEEREALEAGGQDSEDV